MIVLTTELSVPLEVEIGVKMNSLLVVETALAAVLQLEEMEVNPHLVLFVGVLVADGKVEVEVQLPAVALGVPLSAD